MLPPPVPVVVSVFPVGVLKEEDGNCGPWGRYLCPSEGSQLPGWKRGCFQGVELCGALERQASTDHPLHVGVFSIPYGAVPRVTCGKQPKEVSADWATLPEPWLAEPLQTNRT